MEREDMMEHLGTSWNISSILPCNVGIAIINHPPITIFMGGIPTIKNWVVYDIAIPTLHDYQTTSYFEDAGVRTCFSGSGSVRMCSRVWTVPGSERRYVFSQNKEGNSRKQKMNKVIQSKAQNDPIEKKIPPFFH